MPKWFEELFSKSSSSVERKYANLAPTIDVEGTKVYCDALREAVSDPNVYNIAVTGPYGSGKSTVINTFASGLARHPLKISLATFGDDFPESEAHPHKQEIERSIIQKMLYGPDANRLPLSRFKRIRSPGRLAGIKSLAILIGISSAWHLTRLFADLSGEKVGFSSLHWYDYVASVCGLAFVWYFVHAIYLKSYGVSLKSISLSDVEISPDDAAEESILNRHLDEIIYFFQATEYDLVIIEDLDRFCKPEIFATLREINSLINSNDGVTRQVKFIYALRDDMFLSQDRTKFFEFIVPVIPIVNHSNAIDKFLEQGKKLKVDQRLNRQFLRDVSRHLNDLRLIINIFNEFATYASILEKDDDAFLDANKLLAILIYKNCLPSDFAELHDGRGIVADVLRAYEVCIESEERRIKRELDEVEGEISQADEQLPRDITELRRIYAMAIIEMLPPNTRSLRYSGNDVALTDLLKESHLEKILTSKNVNHVNIHNQSAPIDIASVLKGFASPSSLAERTILVERKSRQGRDGLHTRMRDLRKKMASLRLMKSEEVLRQNADIIDPILARAGDKKDILKFLFLEGYIDDTYYQYTSLHHEGRLSPNDRKFLIKIRNYEVLPPDFQIDNASEVLAEMRQTDFQQPFALNVRLVDHLLSVAGPSNADRLGAILKFISGHFGQSSQFLIAHYDFGKDVGRFVSHLCDAWPQFAAEAVKTGVAIRHIARIVKHAELGDLVDKQNQNGVIVDFLSEHLLEVYSEVSGFDLQRLTKVRVQVANLRTISGNQEIREFVLAENLYRISSENIRTIFELSERPDLAANLEGQNFTILLRYGDPCLKAYIMGNLGTYLHNVLLSDELNTKEGEEAVLTILESNDCSEEDKIVFLTMQELIFENVSKVPEAYVPLAIENRAIQPTWDNVLHLVNLAVLDRSIIVDYLKDPRVKKVLTSSSYANDENTLKLSQFLLAQYDFTDPEYDSYISMIPCKFRNFPSEVPTGKQKILVNRKKVSLNAETYGAVASDVELAALLILRNFDHYVGKSSEFPLTDDVRERIFVMGNDNDVRSVVFPNISPEQILASSALATSVAAFLAHPSIDQKLDRLDVLQALVSASASVDVKVALLNKFHTVASDAEVRIILALLDDPYSQIGGFGWTSPRIPNNEANRSLLNWIADRNLISSFSENVLGTELRVNTFRKDPSGT